MKTNELKKGQRVKLRNGWEAELADNMRGNRRMAKVYGYHTETGSVYAHDIVSYARVMMPVNEHGVPEEKTFWMPVEHTKAQLKLKQQVEEFFNA